ncbi:MULTISPECIES: carboxymuconolactone decarboxylase family protein [Rhodococcus]|uniref:Carboxymuconolactone decarboxylase family protein n=1 Tax=Rhodococcus qingshengii JCM 15477 TaxID=1303681 RepID=A0AB38R960_RHOSG|nr:MULTISPECIES: carboxymuconolactone decarboxylase family protein [Rhodococcus]UPU41428.1 carboxymuconolactone decarboxylase family protein [Rhodococcus qingshengii JCM 15477]
MSENTTPDSFDAGLAVRTEVMGADFVDAAFERTRGTDSEELQNFVTANVWGSVWTRPGLDRRSRSLINLGMLIALRAENELKGHVRGALRNGLTRTEIVETVIHASAYCGAPAGLAAMRVVQEVLNAELGPLEN